MTRVRWARVLAIGWVAVSLAAPAGLVWGGDWVRWAATAWWSLNAVVGCAVLTACAWRAGA